MKLGEAHALWGKEVSRLEKLTCKSITTLQDGNRKHQDYLKEETVKHTVAINGMWDRLK